MKEQEKMNKRNEKNDGEAIVSNLLPILFYYIIFYIYL